jgi:hypothetical protein
VVAFIASPAVAAPAAAVAAARAVCAHITASLLFFEAKNFSTSPNVVASVCRSLAASGS